MNTKARQHEIGSDKGQTPPPLRSRGSLHRGTPLCDPNRLGADYVRTSKDLRNWGASKKVAYGGAAGTGPSSAECPFVYFHKDSGYYYLFRTQRYGENSQTSIYRSKDPADFGVENDKYFVTTIPYAAPEIVDYEGQTYIAALLPSLKGIQIAKLRFAPKP